MGAVKINGTTSGSVSLEAPATGSDVTLTLPGTTMNLGTELASKLPIAGGKILQIVRATDGTSRQTSSTSLVDASISVTITPQKNDSAILLIWSFYASTSNNNYMIYQITDSSNNGISGATEKVFGDGSSNTPESSQTAFAWATPATTSATTYKGRFRSFVASPATVTIRNAQSTGQLFAIEVSA